MTIPGLWDKLKEEGTSDPRVPLRIYAKDFYITNGRNLRVGIDAYMWLFELTPQGFATKDAVDVVPKLLLNISSRIRELIKLNISFVFVFDGNFKIYKKRWDRNDDGLVDPISPDKDDFLDFQEYYEDINKRILLGLENHDDEYSVREVKKLLRHWNISYVEAAGEAEAELARLNDLGIIDAIISNDGDGFMFGAKVILKNFSRWLSDNPMSQTVSTRYEKQENEFYVTPYRMDKIESITGITKERMIFIACLNGSDYSGGVAGLGITRCFKLAQLGTSAADDEYFMDYAGELAKIYYSSVEMDRMKAVIPNAFIQREVLLEKLNLMLSKEITENSGTLFKIKHNGKVVLPSDYFCMCHFYPFLSVKVYKFVLFDTNCCDLKDSGEKLRISSIPQPNSIEDGLLIRGNEEDVLSKDSIDKSSEDLVLIEYKRDPTSWFEEPDFNIMCTYNLPISRPVKYFLLDHLSEAYILRVILNPSFIDVNMFIANYKEYTLPAKRRNEDSSNANVVKWIEEQYLVKYNKYSIFGKYLGFDNEPNDNNDSTTADEASDKYHSVWLPKHLLVDSDRGLKMIENYEKEKLQKLNSPKKRSPRKSPKKKAYTQSSTLDNLERSPIKLKDKSLIPDSVYSSPSTKRHFVMDNDEKVSFPTKKQKVELTPMPVLKPDMPTIKETGDSYKIEESRIVIELDTPPPDEVEEQVFNEPSLVVLTDDEHHVVNLSNSLREIEQAEDFNVSNLQHSLAIEAENHNGNVEHKEVEEEDNYVVNLEHTLKEIEEAEDYINLLTSPERKKNLK
ncbi:hypothetical protein CANARDRAFT_29016 [[Candida] arabinofermentans NRRL YB-2248]|uniref:XPG-I domain-containing protein n=1 Tax=[Candida] arabinofermentans NRRL YB-2248 TaxID=983967 RepID=A0A1E4SY93_9ASCO|nr:hypothetical protein CANARDRAFT_29016 [[Candida] arabinofermentans NRRL YB-2248]